MSKVKIERFDPNKTYVTPSGAVLTREMLEEMHPAVFVSSFLAETDPTGEILLALEHIGQARSIAGVSEELTEDEALAAIEAMRNREPEPPLPDATERLAAAQEFANMEAHGEVAVGVLAMNAERGLWSPRMAQAGIAMIADTLSDEEALDIAPLVKKWGEVLAAAEAGDEAKGKLRAGEPFEHEGQLYRAVADVVPQAHQAPGGAGMLAVYRPVDETHSGAADDAIPFRQGLACEAGKHYLDGGVVYLCTRDYEGGTGHSPGQLIGHYFEIVGG